MHRGIARVSAFVIVPDISKKGYYWLVRKSSNELWGLPGGRINENESIIEAAKRESREELGEPVSINGLVKIFEYKNGGGKRFDNYIFSGALSVRPQETLDPLEIKEINRYSYNEILELNKKRQLMYPRVIIYSLESFRKKRVHPLEIITSFEIN
jgi:8-oxo-dGTP diphosphatase